MDKQRPRILVATCGNVMASDDAFGPMVARELRSHALPSVEVIDLDIRPAALLDYLPGKDGLILVDAVHAPGLEPGRVLDIDWFSPDRPGLVNDDTMSTHGLSLAMQLDLARSLDLLPPHVRLIALSIEPARVGQTASEHLTAAVGKAVDLVTKRATYGSTQVAEQQHA
jgi:hydrogenase maturation protease